MSLRSAAFTSGVADEDGPGDEEQRAGLGRGETAEVGAATADELPTAVAALPGVDRQPGHARAPRGRAGRCARETSSSLATSAAVTCPRDCRSSRIATSRSARMSPIVHHKPVTWCPVQGRIMPTWQPRAAPIRRSRRHHSSRPPTIPAPCSSERSPAAEVIGAVTEDQLALPTPCSEFDVRALTAASDVGARACRQPGRGEDARDGRRPSGPCPSTSGGRTGASTSSGGS